MIVEKMTMEELRIEILSDYSYVEGKIASLYPSVRRKMIKSKVKHVIEFFDYLSPKKNKWLLRIQFSKKDAVHTGVVHWVHNSGFHAVMKNNDGTLTYISGHLLDRYNERFLKLGDIQRIEILKIFLKKNQVQMAFPTGIKEDGTEELIWKSADGIVLGNQKRIDGYSFFFMNTFITNEMQFDNQIVHTNKLLEFLDEYISVNYGFDKDQ